MPSDAVCPGLILEAAVAGHVVRLPEWLPVIAAVLSITCYAALAVHLVTHHLIAAAEELAAWRKRSRSHAHLPRNRRKPGAA
jgi:hypothetical protein